MAKERKSSPKRGDWRMPTPEDGKQTVIVEFALSVLAPIRQAAKKKKMRVDEFINEFVAAHFPAKKPKRKPDTWVEREAKSAKGFFPSDHRGR